MSGNPPALETLLVAWAIFLGAAIGSFLNVVVARLPAGQSLVRPRSRCPRCGAAIAWYDNVPIVSFILLRARCRSCGAHISWRYPLVEALGGSAGFLALSRHGLGGAFAAELTFVAVLVALAFIDLDTWLLPNALTWPLIAFGLAASALGLSQAALWPSLLGAALGFAAFAAVSVIGERVFRKEALGFGDVWLLAGIGAFLGAKALLPVVLLASVQGSVVGIALLLAGRATPGPTPGPPAGAQAPAAPEDAWVPPRHAVPFGPFLALGAVEWLYLAEALGRVVPALGLFR